MAELPPGSTLAGCRIQAIVGRGGMGVVYRATQLSLDRPVALKAIAPELAGDVTFRERFKRESRIAASIEHPNVIPVYEAGESEGVLYLIMRYVEGTDLRAVIDAAPGGLEPQRATGLVAQVAAALAAAHRRSLIHRDVKPANVLIDAAGDAEHAYLTDFGIARHSGATSGLTHTGAVIGTIDYLAPERIQGHGGDGRADVYALGCVLFEALTGRQPFERDNDVAKMFAHLSAPVPSAREFRADLPAELDELAQTAMAKEPDDRFATAAEMAEALTEMLPRRTRARRAPAAGAGAWAPTEVAPGGTADDAQAAATGPAPAETGPEVEAAPTGRAPAEAAPPGTERAPAQAAPTGRPPGHAADVGPTRHAPPAGGAHPEFAPTAPAGGHAPRPAGEAPHDVGGPTPPVYDTAAPHASPAAPTVPPPQGPPKRRRPTTAAVGVVLAAVTGAAVVLALASGGGGDDDGGQQQTGGQTTQTQATETTEAPAGLAFAEPTSFDIPAGSDGMAVGEGAVWIANKETDEVLPVEEQSGDVGTPIRVGEEPDSVAVGHSAVWVSNSKSNTVSRIDPISRIVTDEIETGAGPEGVVVTDDAVWVANLAGDSVTRISPDDLSTSTTAVGAGPVQLAVTDDGSLWVTLSEENRVAEIDPSNGVPTGVDARIDGQPRGIAFGAGKLWVSALQKATLARFDPQTPDKVQAIKVPAGPREVRFGLDAVWLNSSTNGILTVIDPSTRKRVDRFKVGKENYGLAVSDSFAWSSSLRAARLIRVAPE